MSRPWSYRSVVILAMTALLVTSCTTGGAPEPPSSSASYEDLLALFDEWRAFQKPVVVDGVPDYSQEAMAAQYRELPEYQRRLASMDPSDWPIHEQVDYHIVRAEMNGLDFDHRVLKPWSRNPAFYTSIWTSQSDVPAREGPVAYGAIELWQYDFPLSDDRAADLTTRLEYIPELLEQAQSNLTGNAKVLWQMGIGTMEAQIVDLERLARRVEGVNENLTLAIEKARDATASYREWLEEEAPSKTGTSGIGIENYDWYLKNVNLLPYTWAEQVTLVKRELYRAHATLRLEENRNRDLPPLSSISSAEEYDREFNTAVDEYIAFLRDEEIVTPKDYMDLAQRERIGRFSPSDGPRSFFSEVSYRDALVMRAHSTHWIDLARMAAEPHASPIRRVPLLYNIFVSRAEGLATGMEEMMLHAGLLDDRPRARELVHILLAMRCARALAGLYMHSNQFEIDELVELASDWTPRGWFPADGALIWWEQHLYLQQPTYGESYVIGKIEIEKLMADRSRQLGDAFNLKQFMDDMDAAGVIPTSLIRWEMTGLDHEVMQMWQPE